MTDLLFSFHLPLEASGDMALFVLSSMNKFLYQVKKTVLNPDLLGTRSQSKHDHGKN